MIIRDSAKTYAVTRHMNHLDEGSQHVVSLRNKKNIPQLSPRTLSFLQSLTINYRCVCPDRDCPTSGHRRKNQASSIHEQAGLGLAYSAANEGTVVPDFPESC